MRKTLSFYSRVLCSLQCNSKSRGELEKVVVGFIKGLADETKCWAPTRGHSQIGQQNLKSGSTNTGAERLCCWNNLTAWILCKSAMVQQLLLNICVGIFPEVSNIDSSKHISEIQTKENPKPLLKTSKQNSI